MKKYMYAMYAIGSLALALAISGGPVAAVAHVENASVSGDASITADTNSSKTDASTNTSAQLRSGEQSSESQNRKQEHTTEASSSESLKSEHATSTDRATEELTTHASEQAREHSNSSLFFELESTTTQAFSLAQLNHMIQVRKHELDQEEASTTLENQDIVKNANEVRLAVHALLAAKPLLGGIGQQVSQVAQQVDASVATTTHAEAQIQARGFWTTLLFGGDTTAADIIKEEVAQNQQRIDALTKLLAQASASAEVQATLKTQIAAIELQQTHLAALAEKEQSQWGFFSWRF